MPVISQTTIRQLTPDDFETMYRIWEEGITEAISNPAPVTTNRQAFCRQFFQNALHQQDHNFKSGAVSMKVN